MNLEESEEGSFFSQLLSLNIIIDLCRLLSRGYSHLYRVFGIIQSSLLPTDSFTATDYSTNQDDFVPLTLYSDDHNNHSFLYLRYLQALQKLVYLMIIDDYLDVLFFFLSQSSPTPPPPSPNGSKRGRKSPRFWDR